MKKLISLAALALPLMAAAAMASTDFNPKESTVSEKITLQEYLATDLARGVIDHQLRARPEADGGVSFYIHPSNVDGRTPDYHVEGNRLVQLRTGASTEPKESELPNAAPRITPAAVEDAIDSEYYHVPPGTTLTLCVLTLRNGFAVTGESACASPTNFDAQVGRRYARADAARKIWPLLGYALREQLHAG